VKKQENINTQDYLSLSDIKDGIIIGRDGSLCIILLCSAINFDLKTEEEQEILVAQYQNFLNSLEFPIQVVIQSRKMELGPYIDKLEERKKKIQNELLHFQLEDYINFLKELISKVDIMKKRFYAVVPYYPPVISAPTSWEQMLHGRPSKKLTETQFNSFKKEVLQRAGVIASALGSMGLRCIQLDDKELIELFYGSYNPGVVEEDKASKALEFEASIKSEKMKKAKR